MNDNQRLWEDLEGLKRHKVWIDEKYRDLEAILDSESVIMEEKSGRIHKNLEDANLRRNNY